MTNDDVEIGVPGTSQARQIGSGAFGRVYRARQDSLDRTVAVKVLANVDLDEEAQSRFDREGKAVGQLSSHPNIVAVYSQGVTDRAQPYLMMEYCSGGSYGDRVRKEGGLAWPEATEVAVAICGALDTAHRAGILHRDVKPDNILIDSYDTPKLADFGIARVSKAANLTQTGTLTGSPAHMPPELVAGEQATPASDVYSLASTLHAMIAGSPAFVRDTDESIVPLLKRISFEDPPSLAKWGVSEEMSEVIQRAMSKDPADRPQSCADFGEELNEARVAAEESPARMKIHGRKRADAEMTRPLRPQGAPAVGGPAAAGAPDAAEASPRPSDSPFTQSANGTYATRATGGAQNPSNNPDWGSTAPPPPPGPAPHPDAGQSPAPGGPQWAGALFRPSPGSGPSAPSANSVVGAQNPFGQPGQFTANPGGGQFAAGPGHPSQFTANSGHPGPGQGQPFAPQQTQPAMSPFHSQPPHSQQQPSARPPKRGRRSMIIAVVAVVVLALAGVGIWQATSGGETAADNGSSGLLVDPQSVNGTWIPTNTVHLDLADTACGTVNADFGSPEQQGYRIDGASTPQWTTVGAPAASPAAAADSFEAWDSTFADCGNNASELAPATLPNLPCSCDSSSAWHYVSEQGQVEYVGMVRKGDAVAAVMAQTSPSGSTNVETLFDGLMSEAAKRVEATG